MIALAVLAILTMAACWWHDAYEWNGGVCRVSGREWQYFDTDSQGGRGYMDKDGNTAWISWPLVDRQRRS
jgi:hypothetical protein